MTINKVVTTDEYAGLFGLSIGDIKNVHLTNLNISVTTTGYSCMGGLVGWNQGTITNCTASGNVSSSSSSLSPPTGGLVGANEIGTIMNCTANCNVSSSSFSNYASSAGGLVGRNGGTITNCTAKGKNIVAESKNGTAYQGGFIGGNSSGTTLSGNKNETGISPAIGWDMRLDPAGPSNDI
jgi:hypothetical protein